MRALFVGPLMALFLLPMAVNAALPPLGEEERIDIADIIVEGRVYDIEEYDVENGPGDVDTHYWVTVQVDKVLKGDSIEPGQEIQVFYWKMKSRPRGWAGPSGQSAQINLFSTIRAYMSDTGYNELLEPNGFTEL